MPCSTAATFGAVAAIRSAIWSLPPESYLSLQGVLNGLTVTQLRAISEKPMSLPPIVSETLVVSASSELNCGGVVSSSVFCGVVMSAVFPPLQLGAGRGRPLAGAARGARVWLGFREPDCALW